MQEGMKLERWPLEKLHPADYNPRVALAPGDKEYEDLKRSIREFGLVDPILVNADGTIIGGHQRFAVLTDLGFEEADVIVLDLDKDREKALNIALNKISGEWDEIKLNELIKEIDLSSLDVSVTGFGDDEIKKLVGKINVPQEILEDDFEESTQQTIVQSGQVWILGNHHLMCGDSSSEEDQSILMGGGKG